MPAGEACAFYLWLNVSSILCNKELEKITLALNEKRRKQAQNLDAGSGDV